jgi:hypothetical protein
MHPQITHMPCDLNQQQKRRDARKASLARAVAARNGHRSWWERLLRRTPAVRELTAEDARNDEGEDVFHGLRF